MTSESSLAFIFIVFCFTVERNSGPKHRWLCPDFWANIHCCLLHQVHRVCWRKSCTNSVSFNTSIIFCNLFLARKVIGQIEYALFGLKLTAIDQVQSAVKCKTLAESRQVGDREGTLFLPHYTHEFKTDLNVNMLQGRPEKGFCRLETVDISAHQKDGHSESQRVFFLSVNFLIGL